MSDKNHHRRGSRCADFITGALANEQAQANVAHLAKVAKGAR